MEIYHPTAAGGIGTPQGNNQVADQVVRDSKEKVKQENKVRHSNHVPLTKDT